MPKAKLSQIAATWMEEEQKPKKAEPPKQKESPQPRKKPEKPHKQVKKKQTFNLKEGTVNRLWAYRVKSGKTISKIIDELVDRNLPK